MKKIFILVCFSIFTVLVSAQTFPDKINDLYTDWVDAYYNNGPAAAQPLGIKYMRAVGLWANLQSAVGTSNNTVATACLTELNSIFKTSYSMPTFEFTESTATYLDLDSLRLADNTGNAYLSKILSTTDVTTLIAANPSVDSGYVNTRIEEAIDSLVIPAADSSFYEITINDTITLSGAADVKLVNTGNLLEIVDFNSAGAKYGSAGISSGSSNGIEINFATPTLAQIPLSPNKTDLNTGFTWLANDKPAIVAGGDSAITITPTLVNVNAALKAESFEDDGGVALNYISGVASLPVDTNIVAFGPSGKVELTMQSIVENTPALIYSQASPPDIPTGWAAYWRDTDDLITYHIIDIGGAQYYTAMNDIP